MKSAKAPPRQRTPRILFDTSVIVAAAVENHPEHSRAVVEVRRAVAGEYDACAATHALVETWAVLTAPPVSPRITPGQARRLVRNNVSSHMDLVVLDEADYEAVVDRMTDLGLAGGATYDALHLHAAEKAGAGRVLTFNRRDFVRLSGGTRVEIVAP